MAPSNMDVAVGESVILPCQVQHDPLLNIMFAWYFNGALTDFKKDGSHFEKVGGVSYTTFLIFVLLYGTMINFLLKNIQYSDNT